MIFKDGQKWACRSCITGHRSSKCVHEERELFPIAKKGRPSTASKCKACREQHQQNVKDGHHSPLVCKCETGPSRTKAKSNSISSANPADSVAVAAGRQDTASSASNTSAAAGGSFALHLKDTKNRKRSNESDASSDQVQHSRRASTHSDRLPDNGDVGIALRPPSLQLHSSNSSSNDSSPAVPLFADGHQPGLTHPLLPLPALHHYSSMPQLPSMLKQTSNMPLTDSNTDMYANGSRDPVPWQQQYSSAPELPSAALCRGDGAQQGPDSRSLQHQHTYYSPYSAYQPPLAGTSNTGLPELTHTAYSSWLEAHYRHNLGPSMQPPSTGSSSQNYDQNMPYLGSTSSFGSFYDSASSSQPTSQSSLQSQLASHYDSNRSATLQSQTLYSSEQDPSYGWDDTPSVSMDNQRYPHSSSFTQYGQQQHMDKQASSFQSDWAATSVSQNQRQVSPRHYGLVGPAGQSYGATEGASSVNLPPPNPVGLGAAANLIPPANIELRLPESRRKNK